ncbi:MAG: hypothetical protein HY787_29840 [Deltaproteobacteria bacterium]|nr:hypothetical protein [Deltaproteobacteria bacterium]
MIYLEETLNLKGASWEALDDFIAFSQETMVPLCPEVGARLVAAWSSSEEWFCQVKQVFEFDDLQALKNFRIKAGRNERWGIYAAGLEDHAPVRRSRLLEPVGAVPVEVLHQAMADSRQTPNLGYVLAILEVGAGKMDPFWAALSESYKNLPIIASWRPIGGSPNEVIDVWKSPEPEKAYQPADDFRKQFMRMVREVAPKEWVVRVLALPYSPLL